MLKWTMQWERKMTEDEAWDELERKQAIKISLKKLTKEEIIKNLFDCIRNLEYRLHDAVLEEREACANLCEDEGKIRLAETIRARGKK
jgi:hypothetical protein